MKKLLLISLLILLSLLVVGCGEQHVYLCKDGSLAADQVIDSKKVVFHCPDGRNTLDYNSCKFDKPITITSKVAEEKSLSFVEGYVRAAGWSSKLVTVYAQDGNWYAQIVLSKKDQTPFETLVRVNGTQGIVTCEENCQYQS
jgi:hypothetical protein